MISWTRGRSAATRRAVKALETSRRSRVWSGGPTRIMLRRNDSRSIVGSWSSRRTSVASRKSLLSRGSDRAASPSSYRAISHASTPRAVTTRRTGPRPLSAR